MTVSNEARSLYNEAYVVDGLNVSNWNSPAVFRSLVNGGVTAINATIATWEGTQETLDHIAHWRPRFVQHASEVLQVRSVSDIETAKCEGKTGVILGFQNASPIEGHLDRLALFHDLGVRIVQVTYHERNLLGNGCYERADCGLSNFGLDAVREMNRLGILIDLSHVGVRTTMETIEVSDEPVACTHANPKSYYDVPRNKAVDALKLIIEKPEATLDELMEIVKGPDFPTAGAIFNQAEIRQAYATGRGRVTMRAVMTMEESALGRTQIVVTELPYQVNKANLLERIADLVRSKRIEGISDLRDESDRHGMRMVIELSRGAAYATVRNLLYKHTALQSTFAVNMLALDNGQPKTLTLKEALKAFVDHRREVIRRRAEFDRAWTSGVSHGVGHQVRQHLA